MPEGVALGAHVRLWVSSRIYQLIIRLMPFFVFPFASPHPLRKYEFAHAKLPPSGSPTTPFRVCTFACGPVTISQLSAFDGLIFGNIAFNCASCGHAEAKSTNHLKMVWLPSACSASSYTASSASVSLSLWLPRGGIGSSRWDKCGALACGCPTPASACQFHSFGEVSSCPAPHFADCRRWLL